VYGWIGGFGTTPENGGSWARQLRGAEIARAARIYLNFFSIMFLLEHNYLVCSVVERLAVWYKRHP